jgi:RNA polymerase sigma factor (sigma-70 family)
MPPAELTDLTALLERYERPLVRYASSLVGDVETARDVVQETFIRFVRSSAHGAAGPAESHAAPSSANGTHPSAPPEQKRLEAWLFTVCRNCAIDHQRKHSRIIPMPLLDHDRLDDAPSPALRLEQNETAALLFRLLDRLSPNQREVIRLKFQNDLSYKEIAQVTQLSVTNVGFLVHTGLKKLRALMGESPGDAWASAAAATEA